MLSPSAGQEGNTKSSTHGVSSYLWDNMENSAHKELQPDLTRGAGRVGKSGSGTALRLISRVAVGKLFCLRVLLLICKRSAGSEIL